MEDSDGIADLLEHGSGERLCGRVDPVEQAAITGGISDTAGLN